MLFSSVYDVIMVSKLKFISVRVFVPDTGHHAVQACQIFQNLYIGKAVGFHQLPHFISLIVSISKQSFPPSFK